MSVLIIAEHDNHTLSPETSKVITASQSLESDCQVLVAGYQCQAVAEQAAGIAGVSKVLLADHPVYTHWLAENMSAVIAELSADYSHLLMAATTTGKNILPRVAGLLDVGLLADVVSIESADTVIRPIYAGNALAKVKSLDSKKLITVRASAFTSSATSGAAAPIVELEKVIESPNSEYVSSEITQSSRPELPAARVVVSGGRGLGDKAHFAMIETLADKLGGAVGASRAAVDAGFVSNDLQVGQTGKIVAPELYIAVGISGAIQHLAGMKDAKVIVAINKDPDAPIFDIADYGLVGDLFEILPELIEKL
ncbi:FAD-binding protein [Photobacterium sp. WH77]|uniref:Electron transfer flavoprotein subunit alpha/FixB family protein n=1 Tax=Photobacterium arenosum TaxID=2774143 RepID=A0ABR9BIC7_9GAMM|nr:MULTISPECIES: FAD-binding protein [Photobacterium]MBD8511206.1 electron transfer flavoprotein subunit alpha/FixB family protein [Photobacterium arenosum]MBV7263153.1 FAD-binding protein [Photobacterium sp. WH24]MCG2837931.1 FAD-binding protein [Photobacterium sp. WH77]MCG2845549.1 FAD-binding protein [Photobacterium sp. WH80]MDO6581869.1 FAD-binding protein [Photobacterium sp. 2_MG-2023]